MFKYTKQQLADKAHEMNFVRDTLEKVLRLCEISNYFNSNPLTKENLALKGGTAINLTILDIPRLSVDIDLDLNNNCNRDEMLKTRALIDEDIRRYIKTNNYELSDRSKFYHALDSYVISYINLGGTKDNIKIELNYMDRCHILCPRVRKVTSLVNENDYQVLSLDPIEIYASKISALYNRAAVRDLYDVYNMITQNIIDSSNVELLRKCSIFYLSMSNNENVLEKTNIDSITQHMIRTNLLPVLHNASEFNVEKAKETVNDYFNSIMVLTKNEKEYLNMLKAKQYCPELLFDDVDIVNRIKNHPMMLWMIRNK